MAVELSGGNGKDMARRGRLQRRASFKTRKGRCSTLNCCIILSLNRFRFKELCRCVKRRRLFTGSMSRCHQSLSSSLMPVFERVLSSTRLTMTAQ
ncbi:hypothetical protein EHI44_05360 [Rhizobium leguminosarum]|nr:hypothetical protein EHI44_05360 [Rhizobium leguminosarum]